MLVVVDRARFVKMLDVARDDRKLTGRAKAEEIPYLRIAATGDGQVTLSGLTAEVTFGATVHRPGVLFLRGAKFRQMVASLKGEKHLTIQVSTGGVEFGDYRIPAAGGDFLVYPDPATAPAHHPGDRQRVAAANEEEIVAARRRMADAREQIILQAEAMAQAERELAGLLGTTPDARATLAKLLKEIGKAGRGKKRGKR